MNLLDAAYALSIGPHYLYHRYVSNKYGPKTAEKTGRLPDRFKTSETVALGSQNPYSDPPCLWLHAVSVGETLAARDLADTFSRENPRWDLLVSTTTATGRALAEKKWGERSVFYYPLDFSWMIERAFKAVRPNMIVLMELEIWPNFLAEAKRRRVPVVVANARITDRSMKRLRFVPWLAREMVESVQAWLAQTEEYAGRLRALGVPETRIEVTGSIKYDALPMELDLDLVEYYRRLFGVGGKRFVEGGDFVVIGGSTHPGEEKTLLQAVKEASLNRPGRTVTVLTPRHPERLNEVEEMAKGFGRVARRSKLREPELAAEGERPDVILVDTMGELAKIYAAGDIVFVGGTLLPHGGQNFMEPCGLARPTLVGPNLWNFAEPAELLKKVDGLKLVASGEELAAALKSFLSDPREAERMGLRAREALLKERGATRKMADRLNALAKAAGGSRT